MKKSELKINEKSIRTELDSYKNAPYRCLFEYIWNAFDAGATVVRVNFDAPREGLGCVENVNIVDNGEGWDFEKVATTNEFISTTRIPNKYKTLPRGKFGRGRYVFIWIAKFLEAFSLGKKMMLRHDTTITKEDLYLRGQKSGTELKFLEITNDFSDALSATDQLHAELVLEFGWFLIQSKTYKILVNDTAVDPNKNIEETKALREKDFPAEIKSQLGNGFRAEIILWKQKPCEYSKFYFLTEDGIEIFKQNTGLNKKGDDFWHSVYIQSPLFQSIEDATEDTQGLTLDFGMDKKVKDLIIQTIKTNLVQMRKPYLVVRSNALLENLKSEKLIPALPEFGIYDEDSYAELLKTVYTITPSLFVGKSSSEKKFMCSTFAGLLSTHDNILIKKILEQLQELSEEEKADLLDILSRTSLSNVVNTIKEIDKRLDVLDKLQYLISEHTKTTLEVKHIQKILDQNFWIFGEQFRLFSSTEGPLKSVLLKYAKEILAIENPALETSPRGEVDLFLVKEQIISGVQKNIIVEIKRASTNLTRDREFRQIEQYKDSILGQSLCNGENQHWEFHLIGKDYDNGIQGYIDSSANHGEKERGLAFFSLNAKIYVRKWSDILVVEWGEKLKYLKEELKIRPKEHGNTPDSITSNLIKN